VLENPNFLDDLDLSGNPIALFPEQVGQLERVPPYTLQATGVHEDGHYRRNRH
jgi:hypothetical protein